MRTRFALVPILLIGAVVTLCGAKPAKAAQKDKTRSTLVRVLERSGALANIRFDDTPGSRTLLYTRIVGNSGEKADQADALSLVALTSVRTVLKNGWYGLQVTLYNHMEPGPLDWWWSSRVSKSDVEEAANALRLLAIEAQRESDELDAAELERFRPRAKAWRDMQEKPPFPEDVRRRRVIAENAIKEKDFDKARAEYHAALEAHPCWPEGQFNLAYISGETKSYRTAILHMKYYLELMPDAPDAEAARDNIIIWQDKIRTNLEREIAESAAGSGRRSR
jgi:hypothetical protein